MKAIKLTAIDLFAGGGGLTVGLKRAGFNVVAAVEIEENAYSTYRANHPEVHVIKEDIRKVTSKTLMELSPTGKIDLLAGCPPCQGFSSLTSKYCRTDPRNKLIKEMGRLVEDIQPRALMMENVPGLAFKGKRLFNALIRKLKRLGYAITWDILQVADFGVPQNRRRLVLLASKDAHISMPEPTHARESTEGKMPWRTLQHVIRNMPEPVTLKTAVETGGPQAHNWHVTRDMQKQNLRRLRHAKPGAGRSKIPKKFRPECHKDTNEGFSNVYGRLDWNQVSATITGGCTTLSKGRFGHPEKDRTISVREAALIQTFPENYIFDTPYMEHVCNIVGNALPCDFAHAIAQQCYNAL